jgi:hypothetical protein
VSILFLLKNYLLADSFVSNDRLPRPDSIHLASPSDYNDREEGFREFYKNTESDVITFMGRYDISHGIARQKIGCAEVL